MWEFIKGNLPKLKERFGGMFLLPRVLEMTIRHFACDDRAKEIEVFVCLFVFHFVYSDQAPT